MRKIALHQNRFSSKNHKKTTPWFADANGSQNRVFSLKCGAWYKDFGLETPKAKNKIDVFYGFTPFEVDLGQGFGGLNLVLLAWCGVWTAGFRHFLV